MDTKKLGDVVATRHEFFKDRLQENINVDLLKEQIDIYNLGLPMAPKQEKESLDPFHENMVRKVYTAKISGPYHNFFMGPGARFLKVLVIYGPVNLSEPLSGQKLRFSKPPLTLSRYLLGR